jgi:hypothetical protein
MNRNGTCVQRVSDVWSESFRFRQVASKCELFLTTKIDVIFVDCRAMDTMLIDVMYLPAEGLTSHMHVADDDNEHIPCEYPLDSAVEDCRNESVVGLAHLRYCQQIVITEPSRMLRLPHPAPPPKHHYSTWWRSVTRRLYRANASSGLKKLQAGKQHHAPGSQN